MKIVDLYQNNRPVISFEFFPPKTDEGELKLFETVRELKELEPAFISVTYGAMGSTRANTIRIVAKIKQEIGIEAAAHLTCVGQTKDEIEGILGELKEAGVENIVALRGDPPKGETQFKPVPNGFRYASELVAFIRGHKEFSKAFSLAVAGYPEGHLECKSLDLDLKNLRHKTDQGADVIVTQLFFDNDDYFRFVERARAVGIEQPIVPGIMPVTQASQIKRFSEMCGSKIPAELADGIALQGDDAAGVEKFGIEFATKQCQNLIDHGAPGLHFYTLNKSKATREIYKNLKLPV